MREHVLRGQGGFSCRERTIQRLQHALPGGGDIEMSFLSVSLMCPLSQRRMAYPGRFKACDHVQCFDIELVMDLMFKQGSQKCPICGYLSFKVTELELDEYFSGVATLKTETSVLISKNGLLKETDRSSSEIVDLTLTSDIEYSDDEPLVKTEDGLKKRTEGVCEISDEEDGDQGEPYFLRTRLGFFPAFRQGPPGGSIERPIIID